jgi:hypothetical protein
MHKINIRNAVNVLLSACLLLTTACSLFPAQSNAVIPVQASQQPHVRRLETPSYVGDRGAIVFTLVQTADNKFKDTTDRIIRLFGENGAPLDIAITPSNDGNYGNYLYLQGYVDAGIIDLSINGTDVKWLEASTTKTDTAYANLLNTLQKSRDRMKFIFGDTPYACIFPQEYFDEGNYTLLKEAGFRVLPTPYQADFNISSEPLGWSGTTEPNGLYRIPIIGAADYGTPLNGKVDPDKKMLTDVSQTITDLGIAVIEIQPGSFTAKDNTPDPVKLNKLSNLLNSCKKLAAIATFEDWYAYTSRWAIGNRAIQRVLPPYNGGPAIIFRIDDVSAGWHEDVVEAIIQLFRKNGVPVDVGVVSNVNGTNSYEMPWLKKYLADGTIGISVHGYDWTYYQFDTTYDQQTLEALTAETCVLPGASQLPPPPRETLTYAYIKFRLMKARDEYLQYFGLKAVALTVPTDYFDETGYRAINDAGFKVFATHITAEPHPSNIPVDFSGRKDPNGMYRIATASDVCVWDNCTWGDVIDISNIMAITDYCKYHSAWDEVVTNEIGNTMCSLLGEIGVAAIGIHPDAFVGIDGKPNQDKLQKLEKIIKWCKTLATITTYEQWYNYTSSQK